MKPILFLALFLISFAGISQSTREIIKDFDGDRIRDTVYIDSDLDKLFCVLSINDFKKTASQEIRSLNFGNTLVETPNGFEFWNDYGRSGFINEFKYDSKTRKMQLVKIKRTDYDIDRNKYGPEVRYGSGKTSINLVTNKYVGDFYVVRDEKLKKLPTIYSELVFPTTYLESFSDMIYFEYEKMCLELYEMAKKETP
ncbi:hypothetical protein [Ulvibacter litoralis]|uniref:Uncharacterized protein n=1 Tax=Ulvibacter litoralis TaxID=227084 RepID=A0A1G7FQ98_9FLAO|nr:hypothetical protein [Ulvibacter litoralis]GHC50189.1 hypothetical protein GCM10008083_12110 [Ulvibacter litoralis]SDE78038.1 hypothetical protein SAMN05421855_102700 [Ulvibacter litoralis]